MITKEKLEHHISHLEEQHAALDKQVDLMEQTGNYVDDDIHLLKKKRLALKDEIEQCRRQIGELNGTT
jgi:hypothetical protein